MSRVRGSISILVVGVALLWCGDRPGTVEDPACEDFERGMCIGAPELCDQTKAILANVELEPPACREGVEALEALAQVPAWQRTAVGGQIMMIVLERGGALTPDQVEWIHAQATAAREGSEFEGEPVTEVDEKLPQSTGGRPYLRITPVIRLSGAGVQVEDRPLEGDLKSSLAPLVAKQVERARGGTPFLHVSVHADASTTARSVIETLETARAAGFRKYWLVAREGETLSQILVFLPHPDPAQAASVVVALGKDRTTIDDQVVPDAAALAEQAAEIHEARDEVFVSLRIEPDVSLQNVIATLDALRGPDCDLDDALTDLHDALTPDLPPTCHLFLPILALST